MNSVVKILAFSFLLSGCLGSGGSGDAATANSNNVRTSQLETEEPGPLETTLVLRDKFGQTSDSFVQGEDIEFVLMVKNNTNEPITMHFNDGQQYDFYVLSSSDAEVWRWSARQGFIQVLTTLTVSPVAPIQASYVWNQGLIGGGALPIGDYTAVGSFLDQSPEARSSFTIQ